ncbi:MAG TPA: MarR family transcriptional regulator [Candidatus Saccharimonas sp.]|nr:MarR family transcriptional regulator [Candidatus Saccharimonas sp.]
MTEENLQDSAYWLLIRVAMRTKHELVVLAEEHHLTPMQLFVLCSLEPNDSWSMQDISRELSCDASNVTGIVDRLQAGHYVTRAECPADRRVKRIALTPAGETLRQKVIARLIETEPAKFANLSRDEITALGALLQKALPTAVPHKAPVAK